MIVMSADLRGEPAVSGASRWIGRPSSAARSCLRPSKRSPRSWCGRSGRRDQCARFRSRPAQTSAWSFVRQIASIVVTCSVLRSNGGPPPPSTCPGGRDRLHGVLRSPRTRHSAISALTTAKVEMPTTTGDAADDPSGARHRGHVAIPTLREGLR